MAVTPQVTTSVKVEPALKVGMIAPPALCNAVIKAAGVPAGQVAVPEVTAQVAAVQFRPVTAASLTMELGALAGPKLTNVTV